MATLKDRLRKWKETRSIWQKTADILFWLLLLLLILPGPRKVIATAVNKVALHVKNPGIKSEEKQVILTDLDYGWVLADAQGTPYYLSDLRGAVIFLNFWATWCPPCVAELPEIQKAYEKHGNEVVFLLVANQEPAVVEAFMEKHGYDIPVFYPGTTVPAVFESASIPTTFIISREGKIVTKKRGAANWDSRATTRIFNELLR
ncbi:MAG: TlpA disulfide reductase family protein [Bacteroidota bacterium]